MSNEMRWHSLKIPASELSLDTTLRCGQSFRWKKIDDTWHCALRGRLVSLRQDTSSSTLFYRSTKPALTGSVETSTPNRVKSNGNGTGKARTPTKRIKLEEGSSANGDLNSEHNEDDETHATDLVRNYLNLDVNLSNLYESWSAADANFKKKAPKFLGVRILKQDAWETVVGFICSSNNNIARISQMVDKLCTHYGTMVGHIGNTPFYDLPPASSLTAPSVETHLRDLGFGYRAKYLYQTALLINAQPASWLDSLRNPEAPLPNMTWSSAGEMPPEGRAGYRSAHESLLTLQGVGPKVADCICLMGLGWGEAVPVDTHVWQIAVRDYKFGKGKHRSLTKMTYDAVGDCFRGLWGKEAGWAHSVLFAADLRTFKERLLEEGEGVKIEVESRETVKVEGDGEKEVLKVEESVRVGDVLVKREEGGDGLGVKEEVVVAGENGKGRKKRKR